MAWLNVLTYALFIGLILSMVWWYFVGPKFLRRIKENRGRIDIQQEKSTILQFVISIVLFGLFGSLLVSVITTSPTNEVVLGDETIFGKYKLQLMQILLCNCGWWIVAIVGFGGRILLNFLMYRNSSS
jgi:hypothetical protein